MILLKKSFDDIKCNNVLHLITTIMKMNNLFSLLSFSIQAHLTLDRSHMTLQNPIPFVNVYIKPTEQCALLFYQFDKDGNYSPTTKNRDL
jgi:hypothetical protein